ncbi:uncharacterized protein LOC117123437 [Anneissia japonica]|uniref:uncharacterized protein LOC117123437 n=1 Tax=Anneissia japonica TaxID=1529436 RepID=UPI0014255EAE|nr:uncharacterized protein LOC117123437 [Anneissia japonica]
MKSTALMMFCLLKSIAGVAIYVTCIFTFTSMACTDFSYQLSNYQVGRITTSITWLEVSSICKSSGGQLVSFNTADESAALLDFLTKNCPSGLYVIGLSRKSGLRRDISANWIWETGEAYQGEIPWNIQVLSDPNEPNAVRSGVRINIEDGKFRDCNVHGDLKTWYRTYGYICEKHVSPNSTYFQTTQQLIGCRHHDSIGTMSAQCFRCALKCFKDDECLAFKYDDGGGCQVKSDLMENAHYYTRLWV